ncbi:glycosyl hydrolase family 28-related protein, partial [Rhodanobacter umsongensis]
MFEQKTGIAASIDATLAARRGTSIRRSLGMAGAALAFSLLALPASAANWWSTSPSISIGSKTINVRNAGALGNGRHDDTAAFQAAINSLPSTGGTITVPAGTYMIDALRSINMRSHVRLQLSSGAKLVAIPNSSQRSHVIKAWKVTNVEITGGAIVGERARHIGTTGEWGMGIDILASSKVYVHDLTIS